MTVTEWIIIFALFISLGWGMNKLIKPRTFFERRMVYLLAFLFSCFLIYAVTEITFRLGR